MDCQQDLAIGTLTILDQTSDSSLLCNGNALFKNSVKIHNDLHLFNNIRTCGNIIPLKHTSSVGTCENPWMDIYASDGTFNTLNVDILNVKQLNCINCIGNNGKNGNNRDYKYHLIKNLTNKYNGLTINYSFDDDYYEVNINMKILHGGKYVINLSDINLDFVKMQTHGDTLNNILCINDSNIYINISLPDGYINNSKVKIMVINPNSYNVRFLNHNTSNNSTEQSYKFTYIDEIKKWLLNYKL